jgi:hypothetical protein
MNKKMLYLVVIVFNCHGLYGPRVHNAQLAFYNPLIIDRNADFMDPDYRRVESKYDDVPLAGLEATLIGSRNKDMDSEDKNHISYVINKIKTEYASIKDSWAGSYNFPIKPIESVSLNDIRTYLDSRNIDFGTRMNALAK